MSRSFIRLSWITLVFIFLVVIAGSIVRSSGAGMGCPDWPKCFDQIIPPTDISQLPDNYQDIYLEKRLKKIDRFVNILNKIGLERVGEQIKNDDSLHREEVFNWVKTYTEYGNRVVGFIAGNLVLITFIWVLIKYRSKRKLLLLSFLNLILISFEGWLGSIVVATNLIPWVLSLHMIFALIIIWIQIEIIHIAQNKKYSISIPKTFKNIFYLSIALTAIQILMGVQVRQEVDFKVIDGVDRSFWIEELKNEFNFLFHRSFSWLLLIVNIYLFWNNKNKHFGIPIFNFILFLLTIEFITGILFSYANMPAITQPIHILVACLILGFQLYGLNYLKYSRESLLR
ncbi:heme A synthase [Putridiphycobacter roseus]|uniref:Heme A synthase n=1 Tax=Putridiphycobacter roseus TaxID=2219161 RepID=A0A2W1MX14_9FLAO|nr:COX15/CtaA family protein [Putridiphycobacter roseus]PZE16669.1 heme A synthase [Putridiphycobacter roseus]